MAQEEPGPGTRDITSAGAVLQNQLAGLLPAES